MSYNKNNIFEVKGAIGELIAANYLFYEKQIPTELATDKDQMVGVDLKHREGVNHNYDVKFSDDKDGISITFRNAKGRRHPYRNGCQAHEIVSVQFYWDKYVEKNTTQKLKDSTEDELEKLLADFVEENELAELVEATRKNSKDTQQALIELYIAHRTHSRLLSEYNRMMHKNNSFKDTRNLIKNFTKAISGIHISQVKSLGETLDNLPDGWSLMNKQGLKVVTKKTRRDRFSNQFESVVFNEKAISRDLYYSEMIKQVEKSHPELSEQATTVLEKVLHTPWKWTKGGFVNIDEKNKELLEMDKASIEWIVKENLKVGSSFKYHFLGGSKFDDYKTKEDKQKVFNEILTYVLDKKEA